MLNSDIKTAVSLCIASDTKATIESKEQMSLSLKQTSFAVACNINGVNAQTTVSSRKTKFFVALEGCRDNLSLPLKRTCSFKCVTSNKKSLKI